MALALVVVNCTHAILNPGFAMWHMQFLPNRLRASFFSSQSIGVAVLVAGATMGASALVDAFKATPHKMCIRDRDEGEAPRNMRKDEITFPSGVSAFWSREAKPAVRTVTDWNRAFISFFGQPMAGSPSDCGLPSSLALSLIHI